MPIAAKMPTCRPVKGSVWTLTGAGAAYCWPATAAGCLQFAPAEAVLAVLITTLPLTSSSWPCASVQYVLTSEQPELAGAAFFVLVTTLPWASSSWPFGFVQ